MPHGIAGFELFAGRSHAEKLFRRIHAYLIKAGHIKGNIIDLGAWIGDNTIPWAKQIPGYVYAIDPSPDNCLFIKTIADLNQLNNVKIINGAISDKVEKLYTDGDLHHCSFVWNVTEKKHSVQASTLDLLFESGAITNIDCIHLDVEGMEFRILSGADALIRHCKPIISYEQHITTEDYMKIVKWLEERGYTSYMIEEVMPHCLPDCRNFLAVPSAALHIIHALEAHFESEKILTEVKSL